MLSKIVVAAALVIGGATGAMAASVDYRSQNPAMRARASSYYAYGMERWHRYNAYGAARWNGYNAYGAVPSNGYYAGQAQQFHRHDLKGW
jgi:hypothetical protein